MDVKPGYKQTEVGVIPEEWDAKHLGDLGSVVRGGSPRPAGDPRYFNGEFIPWLTVAALTNISEHQLTVSQTVGCLTEEGSKLSRTLPEGTLIIANSGATLGVAKLLGVTCCANDGIAAIINQRLGDKQFVCYHVNTQTKRLREVVATGNGQPNLNTGLIREILIPFPPPPEQRAIATALSDVDALLGGLDRLIAKKRDLKQAAMQQLLTGQTRLPGFHGEWELKRLGDAFTITAGKSKSAHVIEDGDFWVCDMGSVSVEGRLIVSKRTNYRGDFLKRGDLIMPKDDIGGGNIIGKVGYIGANDTYILGDHVYCLRALKGDPRFLAYVINSHRVNSELRKKVIGSAQLGLGRKSVNEQEIQFPPHPEQSAIAEVLTDMDAELAALEQRREKTRALKQAMMQELLTGRTRLLSPAAGAKTQAAR